MFRIFVSPTLFCLKGTSLSVFPLKDIPRGCLNKKKKSYARMKGDKSYTLTFLNMVIGNSVILKIGVQRLMTGRNNLQEGYNHLGYIREEC